MKDLLLRLSRGEALSEEETSRVFEQLMSADEEGMSDAQVGAYLFATASRLPRSEELIGAAKLLRKHMVQVQLATPGKDVLDTCGTGGSGYNSFNTSTAVAFVCAAAGIGVAKHGTYAVTSRSGSADVLKALGVGTDLSKKQLVDCFSRTNFCFLFAPSHHPATKRVGQIRRELGFRTIFNLVGPLSNPAGARYQLMGVSRTDLLPIVAEALVGLGTKRGLVVCGKDNLDEITLTQETEVVEVSEAGVKNYEISPEDFGLNRVDFSAISGFEPEQSARQIEAVLQGEKSPYRDLVVLNAGAALYASEKAESIAAGVVLAQETIDSGQAHETLEAVRAATRM